MSARRPCGLRGGGSGGTSNGFDCDPGKRRELWSSERTIPGRKLNSSTPLLCQNPPGRQEVHSRWVSPSGKTAADVFSKCSESSFEIDCGSSAVSLDFGLVSPKKSWCSPPQRIERSQNREWFSPHRVIDRPNPENSPGNWISMKESSLAVQHSPALGVRKESVEAIDFIPPDPECRPSSQTTYALPSDSGVLPQKRKTSVLVDYDPERVLPAKKRTGISGDVLESGSLRAFGNDKIKRLVDPDGHVIKISSLDDFAAPVLGKVQDKGETGESQKATETPKKTVPLKRTKMTRSSPQVSKGQKKKQTEGVIFTRIPVKKETQVEKTTEDKDRKEEEDKENKDKLGDLSKETSTMMMDLQKILRGTGNESENEVEKERARLKKPCPKVVAEKQGEPPEKRRRNVDPKAVQKFIKSQKQKRLEQMKSEKKSKDAEREARKKKLEELRIKTLKLAAQSKKKKPSQSTIKVVEPGTEDDVTMSLGLKQIKPKVSYNESVSKLKKKTPRRQPQSEEIEVEKEEEEKSEAEAEEEDKTLENLDTIQPEKLENLKKPEEAVELKATTDLNETLKRLAETLHLKIKEKEKGLRSRSASGASRASKSAKDCLSHVPSQESVKTFRSNPEKNRQVVTVDLETIHSLKEDIKKISENFKVLHEIIVDKAMDLSKKSEPPPPPKQLEERKQQPEEVAVVAVTEPPQEALEESRNVPEWLESVTPRPHPYNVLTAFREKMNLKRETSSATSQESSTFAERISNNKYDSDFEELSVPGDRLRSTKGLSRRGGGGSESTGEEEDEEEEASSENYYTLKEDSGSDLSSSILDSEKESLSGFPGEKSSKNSRASSSIVTEITSRSVRVTASSTSKTVSKLSADSENLILVTPDLKLISNDLHVEKLNNCDKNLNLLRNIRNSFESAEELNNSVREQKSDSTIAEVIDNLSETEKSSKRELKSVNEKPQNVVQRIEEVHGRRSFFQPEMLHLQFQAELTLLETFQQSLSHFLEAERLKTLSEVNKIVYEKAINTERVVQKEDQTVQTSFLKEITTEEDEEEEEETKSVKTEINVSEEDLEKEIPEDDRVASEKSGSSSGGTLKGEEVEGETHPKDLEASDLSNGHTGISFEMLNRMMKDEELRSEHQLALIRLREKTLNEKVKAELSFLEMKKRALKERGGDEEVSALKKKQRGILMKYQSEKEEIERLKRMHRIASEERRIMIKQQKQIQQMQISTKDMIIKLKKGEKSPQRKSPIKPRALKSWSSQSEIEEDIEVVVSESAGHSTDLEMSSKSVASEEESESFKRIETQIGTSHRGYKPKKSSVDSDKYPRKRHSVEELLSWTKRLEEKENRLKELEEETRREVVSVRNRPKSLKSHSMKDRSTSPFQFQESGKSVSEISPTQMEVADSKKSSTISEAIESASKTDLTEKTDSVPERIHAGDEAGEEFSKKTPQGSLVSRGTEYNSESFESPSSSETPKARLETLRSRSAGTSGSQKGISIKMSLSPRMQSPRRRCSSGSDDSLNLSHTETASEQSDLESRIAALHEELRKRKLEAERLRREQKKAQRERLKVKEQSLLKQIQAYDAYIQKKKRELEQEYEHSSQGASRPLIKQPKVAEKTGAKRQESLPPTASSGRSKESDSEITEDLKEESESAREEIETKAEEEEEEEESKAIESVLEAETSLEGMKSTSFSESLPDPEPEGSQSESEEQSISVKTTLQSPERPETIPSGTLEEETQNRETLEEDVYQTDSFESDLDEKPVKGSEPSETSAEIKTEDVRKEEDAGGGREEKAEKIADSIIVELILESLEVFSAKKTEAEKRLAEESKLTLEALSGYLAREIIAEAVDDMIRIYNRRMAPEEEEVLSPNRITSDIRKRITDIMAQAGGGRDRRRPQELMVTTYDVSPVGTPPGEESSEAADRQEFLDSLTHSKREEAPEEKIFQEEEGGHEENKLETFGQEWFDDDFGLSRTRREAEELRLQQLQIEQEIQQLQAQQEQVPYFYLREIPNKPPPPYTPPGKPLAEIPTSESEIAAITSTAVRILTEEMAKGRRVGEIEPTREYYGSGGSEQVDCYKFFLFDLAKHLIAEVIDHQERKEEALPWMRTRERLSRYRYRRVERTLECLNDFVQKQVSILFGFGKRMGRESLIVRWVKKKRDHVDEILVGESQEEEAQWTHYDEDQVAVKNEVATAILDGLLEDTARVVKLIFNNKTKRK